MDVSYHRPFLPLEPAVIIIIIIISSSSSSSSSSSNCIWVVSRWQFAMSKKTWKD